MTTHSQIQDTAPWSPTLSSLGTRPSCATPGARWCAGPTCLQEDGGEVQRPEAQVAILGAHGARGPGDAEAADGDAGAWVGGAGSAPSSRAPPPAQQGPPTRTEGLLLCEGVTGRLQGQEAASMPHGHALVVNFQDVAAAAAHVAARERQVRAVAAGAGRRAFREGGGEGGTHSVWPSWAGPKARSVNSRAWCSPRSTAQERSTPPRSRHSRTLPRPHDAILRGWEVSGARGGLTIQRPQHPERAGSHLASSKKATRNTWTSASLCACARMMASPPRPSWATPHTSTVCNKPALSARPPTQHLQKKSEKPARAHPGRPQTCLQRGAEDATVSGGEAPREHPASQTLA